MERAADLTLVHLGLQSQATVLQSQDTSSLQSWIFDFVLQMTDKTVYRIELYMIFARLYIGARESKWWNFVSFNELAFCFNHKYDYDYDIEHNFLASAEHQLDTVATILPISSVYSKMFYFTGSFLK